TRRTVDQHARDVLATCTEPVPDYEHPVGAERFAHHGRRWTEPRPRGIICDHDAEGRAVLERELGIGTIAARKSVTDGIQAVQGRLRKAGDGKPRLYVMRGAVVERDPQLDDAKRPTCTEEELVGYVWAVKPGSAGGLKEEPLKENDHGADAMRYLVAERDLSARPRIRRL
ncbi:terminase, partial [Streptomyces sp. AV19]|nr:terminase [Streptomyces sp. AV19]